MKSHIPDVLKSTDFKSQQEPLKSCLFAAGNRPSVLKRQWDKQVINEIFDYGDDYGITHRVVGLVVGGG